MCAALFRGDGGTGRTTPASAASPAGAAPVSGDRTAVWAAHDELHPAAPGFAAQARQGTLRALGLDEHAGHS